VQRLDQNGLMILHAGGAQKTSRTFGAPIEILNFFPEVSALATFFAHLRCARLVTQ
jgi:hypothetical protein